MIKTYIFPDAYALITVYFNVSYVPSDVVVEIFQDTDSVLADCTYDPDNMTVYFQTNPNEFSGLTGDSVTVMLHYLDENGAKIGMDQFEIGLMETIYSAPSDPSDYLEPSEFMYVQTQDTTVDEEKAYFETGFLETTPESEPIAEGLYELDSEEYVPTQDHEIEEDKVYYTKTDILVEAEGSENPAEEGWCELVPVYEEPDQEAVVEEPLFEPVLPNGSENPKESSWFVLDVERGYVETTDEVVDPNTLYYREIPKTYKDDNDFFVELRDWASIIEMNGIVVTDAVPLAVAPDTEPWRLDDPVHGGTVPDENARPS